MSVAVEIIRCYVVCQNSKAVENAQNVRVFVGAIPNGESQGGVHTKACVLLHTRCPDVAFFPRNVSYLERIKSIRRIYRGRYMFHINQNQI